MKENKNKLVFNSNKLVFISNKDLAKDKIVLKYEKLLK